MLESAPDRVRLLMIKLQMHPDRTMGIRNKIVAFKDHLQQNHPDYANYEVFHVMAGSTTESLPDQLIQEDFEGEDSVEQFLEKLYKEEFPT